MTLERRVLCPACSAANIGAQTQCLICQAPLPVAPEPQPAVTPHARFCVNCGAAREDDNPFCVQCGARFAG